MTSATSLYLNIVNLFESISASYYNEIVNHVANNIHNDSGLVELIRIAIDVERADDVNANNPDVMKEVENLVDDALANLPTNEDITIWRLIGVSDDFDINQIPNNKLGVYWSYRLDGVNQYWEGDDDRRIVIKATAQKDSVDWKTTLIQNVFHPDEYEIHLKPNEPITIEAIYEAEDDRGWGVQEKHLTSLYTTPTPAKA